MRGEHQYRQDEAFLVRMHVSNVLLGICCPGLDAFSPSASVLIRIHRSPGERFHTTGLELHHSARQEDVPNPW